MNKFIKCVRRGGFYLVFYKKALKFSGFDMHRSIVIFILHTLPPLYKMF